MSVLSSRAKCKCLFLPKLMVDRELILKNKHWSLIFKWLCYSWLAFLILFCFVYNAGFAHLKGSCSLRPTVFPVAWIMSSKGCPNSLCRSLIFLIFFYFVDAWTLSLFPLQMNSTLATQPSQIFIHQSNTISLPSVSKNKLFLLSLLN